MKPIVAPRLARGSKTTLTRREALRFGASTLAALAALDGIAFKARAGINPVTSTPADRLLFVVTATGGGSIVDSFMPVRESEVLAAGGVPDDMIAYEDQLVVERAVPGEPGNPNRLRALDLPFGSTYRAGIGGEGTEYFISQFLDAHLNDIAVMTVENTSVNHFVAQSRAVNGQGVDGGRHICERAAEVYGQSLVLPFVNMATGGFLDPGTANDLPVYARGEPVVQPIFFALGTDAMRGMVGAPGAPAGQAAIGASLDRARALQARARSVRDQLDDASMFKQTFQCSPLLQKVLADRRFAATGIEPAELVSNLFFLTEVNPAAFGLELTEDAQGIRGLVEAMNNQPARSCFTDPYLAQIVLAYLLAKFGYSSSMCLGVPFSADVLNLDVNPPLSFDFSHTNHVASQAIMWSRVLDGVNKLITLLKQTPVAGGGTMWDRSVVYIASDFGRDKVRSESGRPLAEGTSTGHHLNNGAVLVSPSLRGGRRYGGIDPTTLLTHGFDRGTGEPLVDTTMREADVYSAITQALGISFPGQTDMSIMMR